MKNLKITVNGQTYDVQVEEVGSTETVQPVAAATTAAPAQAPKAVAPVSAAGSIKVESPMPGTIVDVKVKENQQVKSGDVLVVLEAMKMENEIKAESDGKVASVNTSKGASVETGTLLVTLE